MPANDVTEGPDTRRGDWRANRPLDVKAADRSVFNQLTFGSGQVECPVGRYNELRAATRVEFARLRIQEDGFPIPV